MTCTSKAETRLMPCVQYILKTNYDYDVRNI